MTEQRDGQTQVTTSHDVIKWEHFPRYWPFVRGIHRSPMDTPHKGQRRRALMFSLIHAWTNSWACNLEASDFKRHRTHYDVTVMCERDTDFPNVSSRYLSHGMCFDVLCQVISDIHNAFIKSIWFDQIIHPLNSAEFIWDRMLTTAPWCVFQWCL